MKEVWRQHLHSRHLYLFFFSPLNTAETWGFLVHSDKEKKIDSGIHNFSPLLDKLEDECSDIWQFRLTLSSRNK